MNPINRQLACSIALALLLAPFATRAAEAPPSEEAISADADTAKALDRSYSFSGDGSIEISNVRGSVTVTGSSENRIGLGGSLGAGSRLIVEGDAKHIELHVEAQHPGGVLGKHGPPSDTSLVLSVPHAVALKLELVSADSKVTGIDGKSLEIESVSGMVHASGAPRSIEIDNVSGGVKFDALHAGAIERAHVQTVSGDIGVGGVEGRVKLETVSGRIGYVAPSVTEFNAESVSGTIDVATAPAKGAHLRAETMSGTVKMRLPAALSARLSASTFSGGIKSDFGSVKKAEYGPGSSLDARVGDGDARIETESFSGSIELRNQ
ncbi:MAG: DUF4097 domain-containing protein [Gammaproteobacteria bacterium]|nr:MAG: DUF4097 domain-containing protein [Gammaproteobacteria bacterium]